MSRAPLFVLVAFFLAPSALLAQADGKLVGTWEAKVQGGVTVILDLRAEGEGKMDDQAIQWRVDGKTLELNVDGTAFAYTIELEGDSLRLSGGDLDEPMTFARKGGKKGLGGKKKGLAGKLGGGTGGETKPPVEPPKETRPPVEPPKATKPTIVGEWETQGAEGIVPMVIKADNTGCLGTKEFHYLSTGYSLTIFTDKEQTEYRYELNGDTLILSGGDLSEPLQFQRKGTAVAPAPGPTPGPRPAPSKGLVGMWRSPIDSFEIRADGTLVAEGTIVKYEVKGTTFTLVGPGGRAPYEYTLDGDTLTMTREGTTTTYERVDAAAEPAPGPTPGPAAATPKGLVGTWKSPNETIELRADGTLLVGGQTLKYEVKGSVFTLAGPNGTASFEYTLDGDTMTLTSDGTTDTYQRVGPGGK